MNSSMAYSFNLAKEIKEFSKLPAENRRCIESLVVKVIYESFVVPADQDYLAARFLIQNNLDRMFYWHAAQALEKYFKAYLLLRGYSVKQYSHGICKLWNDVLKHDPTICKIDVTPHPDVAVPEFVKKYIRSLDDVDKFIQDIGKFGSPANRYNAEGVVIETAYYYALDSFVFGFRKHIGCPDIFNSFSTLTRAAVEGFLLDNPNYHVPEEASYLRRLKSKPGVRIAHYTTTLEQLKNGCFGDDGTRALDWLNKKMKIG